MTDSFNNLRDSMKQTVFKKLSFSDDRKNAVKEAFRGKQPHPHPQFWDEETIISVLFSLQQGSKKGYDISTELLQKHDLSFQKNEGQLYTLLHLLENKEILTSEWINEI